MHKSPVDRFFAKIEKSPTGCWLWLGAKTNGGYGKIFVEGSFLLAHRFAYQEFVGPLAPDLKIDHLCKLPQCVNPEHLDQVSQKENLLRGDTFAAENSSKTECSQGHEYTDANTYTDLVGKRHCRECRKTRKREYYWRMIENKREEVNKKARENYRKRQARKNRNA